MLKCLLESSRLKWVLAISFMFAPVIALSQTASLSTCENPRGLSSIRNRIAISSKTGKAVAISLNTIQTWDTTTGKLVNSQALPIIGSPYLMGFVNADEVIIFDYNDVSDTSAVSNKGYKFNTKTLKGQFIWTDSCGVNQCLNPVEDSLGKRFSQYILLGRTLGPLPPSVDYVFDLLTGQRTIIRGDITNHVGGGFSNSSPYFYGMSDETGYPNQLKYSVSRWNLPSTDQRQAVVTFDLADLTDNPMNNVETDYPPVIVGADENIVVPMNVNDDRGRLQKQVFLWYSLSSNTRKICSLQTNDHHRFQMVDEHSKVGLLFDELIGNEEMAKYINFSDCSVVDVPNTQKLTYSGGEGKTHAELFLTEDVLGKRLFFNNNHVVDSTNGKILVQLCQ